MITWLKRQLSKNRLIYSLAYRLLHFAIGFAAFPIKAFLVIKSRFAFYKLVNSGQKYDLHFMHRCGGGTEVYVQNTLRGKTGYILLRNFKILRFQEIFTLEIAQSKRLIYIFLKDIAKLNSVASNVYIENIYSYKKLERVLETVADFSAKITYKLHDLYSLCYNVTMVKNNACCGTVCDSQCSLSMNGRIYTPKKWRDVWGAFFERVDEVFVFSENSKKILLAVYPQTSKKILVKPHDMSYCKVKRLNGLPSAMNVGVFGNITYDAKGYSVLKSFAEFSMGKDYKICMNGLVGDSRPDAFFKNENFIQYGSYKTDEIYDRIVSQNIGVVFFTSVCPETFSYVVSELMIAGVPIACFDVGAQADKIKEYPLGKIIPDYTNESILSTLKECYENGKVFYRKLKDSSND